MNAPDADMPEYGDHAPGFLADDQLPETLEPLFRHIAEELIPEIADKATWLARFVVDTQPRAGAPVTDRPHQRVIGSVDTTFRGVPIASGVQPYMFFLWQRITDAADALDEDRLAQVRAWLEAAGLLPLLDVPRAVRIERSGHVERWGAPIAATAAR